MRSPPRIAFHGSGAPSSPPSILPHPTPRARVSLRRLLVLAASVLLAAGCVSPRPSPAPADAGPPAWLLGEFEDDYGSRYTITADAWTHHGAGTYQARKWVPRGEYLVAQNDSANRYAPGRWTRIDWIRLEGMPPYSWAFCLSAYEAATAADAEAVTVANRETPRTGCSGHPFSRMKRVSP